LGQPNTFLAPEDELEVRFDLIDQLGIRELDIWVGKVPDSWLVCFDEGLLSFCLPHSRLYGEYL
jgi:hypothetical protein